MELQQHTGNFIGLALILGFLPLVQLQLQPYYPRQLYYEAPPPRLRRLEYAPYSMPPPAAHYQQQIPNFQLINYRTSYPSQALDYHHPQPAPAPPLPPLYSQPSIQYQQRALAPHAELAKYRYEGNYLPVPQRRVEDQQQQLYNVPPALFTSDVLHVVPPRLARLQEQQQQPQQQQPSSERPRRFAPAADALAAESKSQKTKYFHDLFMRFENPNSRSQGHVLSNPKAQERRFETQRGTNRYKGEVIWTDRQGGHGEHRWDLAQGKL